MVGQSGDNSENPQQVKLMDKIGKKTTREEFENLVDGMVTDGDRRLFGPKAKDFIMQAILYPSVFAPAPATFASDAYAFVIDDVVSEGGYDEMDRTVDPDRIDRLLTISLENGVVDMEESGRLSIPKEVQEVLEPILEQYEAE